MHYFLNFFSWWIRKQELTIYFVIIVINSNLVSINFPGLKYTTISGDTRQSHVSNIPPNPSDGFLNHQILPTQTPFSAVNYRNPETFRKNPFREQPIKDPSFQDPSLRDPSLRDPSLGSTYPGMYFPAEEGEDKNPFNYDFTIGGGSRERSNPVLSFLNNGPVSQV